MTSTAHSPHWATPSVSGLERFRQQLRYLRMRQIQKSVTMRGFAAAW